VAHLYQARTQYRLVCETPSIGPDARLEEPSRSLPVAELLLDRRPLFGRYLFRAELHLQFVQLAGEGERHLVVFLVHRSAGINADAERLALWETATKTVRRWVAVHDLAIDLERASAAFAQSRTVVLPVELHRVFAPARAPLDPATSRFQAE
jgi:hypothetical protein